MGRCTRMMFKRALLLLPLGAAACGGNEQRIGEHWFVAEMPRLAEAGPPARLLVRRTGSERIVVDRAIEYHHFYDPDCVIYQTAARAHQVLAVCGARTPVAIASSSALQWRFERDGLRRDLQMRAEGDRVLQDVEHLPVDQIRALAQQQPRYRRGWEATAALDADNPPIPPRLSQQSPRGNTGLMEAARRNDPSLVDALLGQGEDVNARDESGVTALHIAAGKFWNDGVILSKLIAAGADVNAQDDHGATPLMYASGKGEVLAVKLLVEAGADGSIRAEDGKTARERIPSSENEELLALLRRAEGRH